MVNPLRGMYTHMIETKVLPGPNPCADLKWFVGRSGNEVKASDVPYFAPEEGRIVLEAMQHLHPRWHAFTMTAFMAGLRWGEIAALRRDDLNVERALLTVERTISSGKIASTKTGKVRHVKVSRALLKVLHDPWRRWPSTRRPASGHPRRGSSCSRL
jgi:integrase